MYSTCVFCNKPLGTNEALDAFPVGRRLAFDAAKGRLWVVCPHCERWNLSPLEERWEAIEQAERLYRDTRLRTATDQIGLARLRDGTDLVRIGAPMRPEFAAWRYGDQFGRRRRRQVALAGAGLAGLGAIVGGGIAAGVAVGGFGWGISRMVRFVVHGSPRTVVAHLSLSDGEILHVRRRHLSGTQLHRGDDGSLALDLQHEHGVRSFVGHDAIRVAGIVVPKVNRFGGSQKTIAEAVKTIETGDGPEGYLRNLAGIAAPLTRSPLKQRKRGIDTSFSPSHGLYGLPPFHRLALEMALHEEAERRAMEGELAELERAWEDAEQIASIADDLLVPDGVLDTLKRLKRVP